MIRGITHLNHIDVALLQYSQPNDINNLVFVTLTIW